MTSKNAQIGQAEDERWPKMGCKWKVYCNLKHLRVNETKNTCRNNSGFANYVFMSTGGGKTCKDKNASIHKIILIMRDPN